MYRILLILVFHLVIVVCAQAQNTVPDVVAAFRSISDRPQVFRLGRTKIKIPGGGHLQGIQALSDSQMIVTASSASYSYYLTANRTEFISVHKLSDSPFRHAGGFQICDSIIIIGVEDNIAKNKSHILRLVFDDSTHIIDKSLVVSREGIFKRSTAGAVGLARTVTGQYFLAVADWDSRNIDFYISRLGHAKSFDSVSTFHIPNLRPWPSYQSINILTDTAGKLYMIGFALDGGHDRADLFEIITHNFDLSLKLIQSRHFHCRAGAGFRYGSGIYIKDGQLVIYSIARNISTKTGVNIFK